MQWLKSKPSSGITEVNSVAECADLLNRDLVILFKHSPSCPVSWMAHREVTKFATGQPGTPLYMVLVRQRRDVAQMIAEKTGIQHESPQIIVLRNGSVVGHASHDDVTAELLAQLTSEQTATFQTSEVPIL